MAAEYVPHGDAPEVLVEQFRYLLEYHGALHADRYCSDCERMAMIRIALLQPFTPRHLARAARA